MPYLVNGQLVTNDRIRAEEARISNHPQWRDIGDETARAKRIRVQGEISAIDAMLVGQIPAGDPGPAEPELVEHQVRMQKAMGSGVGTHDDRQMRAWAERTPACSAAPNEVTARAAKPTQTAADMKDHSTTRCSRIRRQRQPSRVMLLAALALLIPHASVAQAPTYETLYSFKGSPDGGDPKAGVVIGKNGALYGTTYGGGASVLGTVFELTKPAGEPWKEGVLYNFNGSDGQYPESALVLGSTTGALYSVTVGGGCGGCTGVVFELAPPSAAGGTWTETVLHAFSGSSENAAPNGPLLIGPGGTLYATTQGSGGPTGTAAALLPPATLGAPWTESVLYTFGGSPGGGWPFAGVVSEGGSLLGTTLYGGDEFCGAFGCGVVYELTPPTTPSGAAWTEATLHTFTGPPSDGAEPQAALAVGPGGALYGTTYYGGPGVCATSGGIEFGCGTVFQLTPPTVSSGTWAYAVIYNFTGADGDGALPVAGVVVGKNGAIYGTTSSAGSATPACPASYYVVAGCGIVFELTPPSSPGGAWTETVLHAFTGENGEGAIPLAGLALSSSGVLYGTTSAGGAAGRGTVFAIEP